MNDTSQGDQLQTLLGAMAADCRAFQASALPISQGGSRRPIGLYVLELAAEGRFSTPKRLITITVRSARSPMASISRRQGSELEGWWER
jgi:hypothetical protein